MHIESWWKWPVFFKPLPTNPIKYNCARIQTHKVWDKKALCFFLCHLKGFFMPTFSCHRMLPSSLQRHKIYYRKYKSLPHICRKLISYITCSNQLSVFHLSIAWNLKTHLGYKAENFLRPTLRLLKSKPAFKQGDFQELLKIKQLNWFNHLSSSSVTFVKLQIQNVHAALDFRISKGYLKKVNS